jgi:SAM-dependent methyltransferase
LIFGGKTMNKITMSRELILNARKPEGEIGSQMIEIMNEAHEEVSKWGISHLNVNENDIILDIGCGGGVNVKTFSEMAKNEKVYGLDYSELSVEKSREFNKLAIDEEKVEIVHGSVSSLPFKDETFDIVTAFQSTYFWPNFDDDLNEVSRVLKPNGFIFICNGDTLTDKVEEDIEKFVEELDRKIYSEEELNSYLSDARFSNISIFKKTGTNWMCAVASKL